MSYRDHLIDRRIARRLSSYQFTPSGTLRLYKSHIGILFSGDQLVHHQEVNKLAQTLKDRYTAHTHQLGFLNRKLDPNVVMGFPHVSRSDISFWRAESNGKNVELFLQRDYQLIINLDLDDYPLLHQISHKANAKHKLGTNRAYANIYDIIVDISKEEELTNVIEKTLDLFSKINQP